MPKLKVLTVVGTRPEIIRLSCILHKLDTSECIQHVLVHTGQNYDYELNQIFFSDLNLRLPDYYLDAAGKDSIETIGNILIKINSIIEQELPDAFLILGDTNSCLSAIAAKKHHIPIFHLEAGNRCFDQRVPEETNRKIVDHISDLNLTYSTIAREYLISEGLASDRIIKIGSPMNEVIHNYLPKVNLSTVLERFSLMKNEYFVVSAHREENISSEKNFDSLINIINTMAFTFQKKIIVSTHPRTRKMIDDKKTSFNELVVLAKPFGLCDYLSLQMNAKAVLSDSGTISEESSILSFPALNIRETHERPEAMEESAVIMTGLNLDRIFQSLSQLEGETKNNIYFSKVADYSMTNVSDKVVRIILSYTDYVKRTVWNE